MSKFPLPVIASNPLRDLILDFLGMFFEFKLPNSELTTQGGLPNTKIL